MRLRQIANWDGRSNTASSLLGSFFWIHSAEALALDESTALTPTYQQWEGLPALIGSLPFLSEVKAGNANLKRLLEQLDALEETTCLADLVQAMEKCRFSADDVKQLNSPLLRGLCAVVYASADDLPAAATAPTVTPSTNGDSRTAGDAVVGLAAPSAKTSAQELLCRAVRVGADPSTLEFLLARTCIADKQAAGDSAARLACATGNVGALDVLLDHGARVKANDMNTLLLMSSSGATQKSASLIGMLVERWARVNATWYERMEDAVLLNNAALVDALLKNGNGRTPSFSLVQLCCCEHRLHVLKVFLDRDACDADTLNSMFELGCEQRMDWLVECMIDRGFRMTTSHWVYWCRALRSGNLDLIRTFVRGGADVHWYKDDALDVAIAAGNVAVLEYLLSLDDDRANFFFDYALTAAVRYKRPVMLRLLLELGGNPNCFKGDLLCFAIEEDNLDALSLLLAYGADVHIADDEPSRAAVEAKLPRMLCELVKHGVAVTRCYELIIESSIEDTELMSALITEFPGAFDVPALEKCLGLASRKGRPSLVAFLQDQLTSRAAEEAAERAVHDVPMSSLNLDVQLAA